MNVQEMTKILTMITTLERNRNFDAGDAAGWLAIAGDCSFEDAREAVVVWHATDRREMQVADLLMMVKKQRRARMKDRLAPVPPVDPDDTTAYRAWLAAFWEAIGDGETEQQAEKSATHCLERKGIKCLTR